MLLESGKGVEGAVTFVAVCHWDAVATKGEKIGVSSSNSNGY